MTYGPRKNSDLIRYVPAHYLEKTPGVKFRYCEKASNILLLLNSSGFLKISLPLNDMEILLSPGTF